MRHGDQLAGPLPHRFAAERGNPVLGHDVVDERARDRHDGSLGQHADDARHAAALDQVAGRQHGDGAASFGVLGGDHKRRLASDAGPNAGADSLRGDLAGKVDEQGVVDRDQVVLLQEQADIIGVAEVVQLEGRVAVDHL